MSDLICRGLFVGVLVVILWLVYSRFYSQGYDHHHDPLYFDRSDPADRYEHAAITEQRRYGRERGGPLIWRDSDD